MSYALLGEIAFDLLHAPSQLDETHQAQYVQHDVLSGKPKLQAMGLNLIQLNLDIQLHHQIGHVEQRYQALLNAKQQLKPLALVLGNGTFKGYFVLTEVTSKTLFTDEKGQALARDVSLRLKEFADELDESFIGEAVQIGTNMPLSSLIVKRNPLEFMDKNRGLLHKAMQSYQRARQMIDVVRNMVQTVRQLKNDPVSALASIATLSLQLNNALGGLRDVFADVALLQGFASHLESVNDFVSGLRKMTSTFDEILSISQSATAQTLNQWISVSSESIERADKIAKEIMQPATQMTAWISLRQDITFGAEP